MSIYQQLEDSYHLQKDLRKLKALYANWSFVRHDCEVLKSSGNGTAFTKCWQDLEKIKNELNQIKTRIDTQLSALQSTPHTFRKNGSKNALEKDLSLLRRDLNEILTLNDPTHTPAAFAKHFWYGSKVTLNRLSRAEEDHGYLETFFKQKEVMEEIIAELAREIQVKEPDDESVTEDQYENQFIEKNRQLEAENLTLAEEKSGLKNTVTDLQETISRLKYELKQATKKKGSRYDEAAGKYLSVADEKEKVLRRIMDQWKERREKTPEDQRRTVDKLYRGILDKFNEEL